MELTPRLRILADQVPKGAKFSDIGTDHGYLPVWLILNGVINFAIAADLRVGPLERAKQTAAQYGIEEKLSFRLCDGLSGIDPEETDVIAIAGIGGDTITNILAAALWTREDGKTLLLQPMTAQPELRQWLGANGFSIVKEQISCEGERLYSVWTVSGGQMPHLSPGELWAGRQNCEALRGKYLDHMIGKVNRALTGHMLALEPKIDEITVLQTVLTDLLRMKREWLSWQ